MAKTKNTLKAKDNLELLSYVINVTPELREDIDLPTQGQSIKEYGKLIMDCERHKNAFLNTCNLIGLTVIKRNFWASNWDFTYRGELSWGESVREIITDLAPVFDYNENVDDVTRFLQTVVPDVFTYIHEINIQKFYEQTTSDEQMAMAFERGDLFGFIDIIISMNYEALKFDLFQVDKYMLARRILDGTVSPVTIDLTADNRKQAVKILETSNNMTFRSPNFNPAGVSRANTFDEMILIVTSAYQARFDVETLSTSFHIEKVDNKQGRIELIDSFGIFDEERLARFIGKDYKPFTPEEIEILKSIPAVIVSREFFMNYSYNWGIYSEPLNGYSYAGRGKATNFYNPTTLRDNHYLHYWGIASTSPFEQACVFVGEDGTVTSVTVAPSEATLPVGGSVKMTATTETTGVINKAVIWEVSDTDLAEITQSGVFTAKGTGTVIVTATSIADNTVTGTATITIS